MRALLDPLNVELDPETQAMVDAVCASLADDSGEDPWDVGTIRSLAVGWSWLVALLRSGDHRCRQRIMAHVEEAVRADGSVWIGGDGICVPQETIRAWHGRVVYVPDAETGELREVLQWPTG